MDPPNNTKDSGLADDALQLRRVRQRVRRAAMTDEQRDEKNRKRREAYKRKKNNANKENEPGCNIQDFKPSDADTNIAEDPTGISGLRPESDRTLSALNSDDKGLERNKKSREAYRMKKDVSQGGAIISSGGCFDWTHICTIIYACLYLNMFSDIAAADDHVECISSTAPIIDHPPNSMLCKHLLQCLCPSDKQTLTCISCSSYA